MREKWWSCKNYFYQCIIKLLKQYKYYLLVFFLLFLISFITGILTCSNYASDISCDNLINKYLLSYLTKERSYLSFFLMMGVWFLLIALFFVCFTCNAFMSVVDTIILSLISYILGFDVCVITVCLGLAGVIFGILVYAMIGILIMILLVVIMSLATRRLRERRLSCDNVSSGQYIKLYIAFIVLAEIMLFVMSVIMGVIHIFVIVE